MKRVEYIQRVQQDWQRARPDREVSVLGSVLRIVWSGRLAETLLDRAAVASGLRRRGDYEVLAMLRRADTERPIPNDLARRLMVSASGMTGKLDRLENQGLVERVRDANDRRVIRIALTDEGRVVADRAFDVSLGLHEAIIDCMDQSEREELDRLLIALLDRLEDLAGTQDPWLE